MPLYASHQGTENWADKNMAHPERIGLPVENMNHLVPTGLPVDWNTDCLVKDSPLMKENLVPMHGVGGKPLLSNCI